MWIHSALKRVPDMKRTFQSNTFAVSVQYLKKLGRNEVHFLHADKHQKFLQVGIIVLM